MVRGRREEDLLGPKPIGLSKDDIEAVVEVNQKPGKVFGTGPCADLDAICATFGVRVQYVGATSPRLSDTASVLVWGPKDVDVFLPSFDSYHRNRFSLAHEL